MTSEKFEKLLADMKADDERTHALYKLGVNTIDYDLDAQIITALGIETFGQYGWDTIEWFLWERKDNGEPQMWEKDGGPPLCYDIPSLFEYVQKEAVNTRHKRHIHHIDGTKRFCDACGERLKGDLRLCEWCDSEDKRSDEMLKTVST